MVLLCVLKQKIDTHTQYLNIYEILIYFNMHMYAVYVDDQHSCFNLNAHAFSKLLQHTFTVRCSRIGDSSVAQQATAPDSRPVSAHLLCSQIRDLPSASAGCTPANITPASPAAHTDTSRPAEHRGAAEEEPPRHGECVTLKHERRL